MGECDDCKHNDDIVPGSAEEQWDNLHNTIEKHGIFGIIAVVSMMTVLCLVCLLILSIFGLG